MVKFVTNQQEIGNSDVYELISPEQFKAELSIFSGNVGIDTETEGFNPYTCKMLSLQIGNKDIQYVIDYAAVGASVRDALSKFFKETDKIFLFHNAKFDLRFLMLEGIWPKYVYDSFLAESVLYQGLHYEQYPKDLKSIAKKYCNADLDKDIRGQIHWKGLTPEVIKYAAEDVAYLEDIKIAQEALLREQNLLRVSSLENEFVKVLAYIEMCGLRLDLSTWKERIKADKELLNEKLEALNQYILNHPDKFGKYIDGQLDLFSSDLKCKINWRSPTQTVNFFKELGLNLLTKDKATGKMKYSVDAKVLTPQKHIDPIIDVYLDYKGQEKVISTYGDNWITQISPVTGRIHTQFKQLIDTARLSSGGKNKKTGENYINFLNIPQDNAIRNCIIPRDGYSFIDSDYSGQESIVLANKSMEPSLIDFYNKDGGDLHSFVASKIYPECAGVPLDEIKTKFKQQRQNAKAANFAIAYGGVGATIAANLSIPVEDGDRVYNAYLDAFPKLKQFFSTQKKKALSLGYILTDEVSNRRIYLQGFDEYKQLAALMTPDFWEDYRAEKEANSPRFKNELKPIVSKYFKLKGDFERMALNYPIQSASASITKLACIYVYRIIEAGDLQFKVLFPNVVHDQIILEVPDEETSKWSTIVKECMEKAGDLFCTTVKLKAEPEILKKWKK